MDFKEVAKLPPSFSLKYGNKFIKRPIPILRDIPHPINKTNGMADMLLISPEGAYNGKVPKAEEYI